MYVAVAYNEVFFVGIVTEIIDNHSAFVKFMKWKKQQLVSWSTFIDLKFNI
jgi:hypothetical protein